MSKNYMLEVARMLGVEIGEPFDAIVENGITSPCGPFYFDENWKIRDNNDGIVPYWFLEKILIGEYTLQKRPWRPKTGEDYWHVKTNGVIDCESYEDWDVDLYRLSTGNCFRTIGEAEANKQKILDHFEQIRSGELRLEEEE